MKPQLNNIKSTYGHSERMTDVKQIQFISAEVDDSQFLFTKKKYFILVYFVTEILTWILLAID